MNNKFSFDSPQRKTSDQDFKYEQLNVPSAPMAPQKDFQEQFNEYQDSKAFNMRPFNLEDTSENQTNKVNPSDTRNQLQLPVFDFSSLNFNLSDKIGCGLNASFDSPKIKESYGHISRFNIHENEENIYDKVQTTPKKRNRRDFSESSDENMRSIQCAPIKPNSFLNNEARRNLYTKSVSEKSDTSMQNSSAKKALFQEEEREFNSPVNLKKMNDNSDSLYQDSTAYMTKRKQITEYKEETAQKFLFTDSSHEDLTLRKQYNIDKNDQKTYTSGIHVFNLNEEDLFDDVQKSIGNLKIIDLNQYNEKAAKQECKIDASPRSPYNSQISKGLRY